MKLNIIEVDTTTKLKLCKLLEQLNKRHNRAETVMDFVDDRIVDSEGTGHIYPVPANTKESVNLFTGTLLTLL